jgi:hypothetical protein
LFHDIETPSRDLDSSEYSPVRSSEEPLLQSEVSICTLFTVCIIDFADIDGSSSCPVYGFDFSLQLDP